MSDYTLATVIGKLMSDGEPAEWKRKNAPTFIPRPTSDEEYKENFKRYIAGYPWIVVAADKGGFLRYHCAICWGGATVSHFLSDCHIDRACRNFGEPGQTMPAWMARFQSVDISKGNLFNRSEHDIYPPVCGRCDANLSDPNAPRCNFCTPPARQRPADAADDHDDVPPTDTGKRFRHTDASEGAGSVHPDRPKLSVKRNDCRDVRVKDQARGSTQAGTRWELPSIDGRQEPFGRRHPKRKADSRSALVQVRCPDEPLLRMACIRDLEKYVREHKRLFSTDHFFPYGPWSTDFKHWPDFLEALYKSSRETTSMGARIWQDGADSLVISPAKRWGIHPQAGERIVISRTHPTMDKIIAGIVTKVSNDYFRIEWESHWGQFDEFAAKVQPEDKHCPDDHFRVDIEIECISTVRVEHCSRSPRFKARKNSTSPSSPQFRP